MTDLVTRFAPSPTGYLHLGHAYSALVGYEAARAAGGRFLLRIEDIDHTRCRPAFEAAIYDDLAWLGVAWETPVRRQSDHLSDYRAALDRLRDRGLLYRCFRTRKAALDEIGRAPHHPPAALTPGPLPPGEEAQKLVQGAPFAWRLSLDRARDALGGFDGLGFEEVGQGPNGERGWITPDPTTEGDVVLARKDLGVAYHLAVVVDDAAQGVTQVTRGADLFTATGLQRLLQTLLSLPTPTYRHHPLLLGPDGKRLAKRNGGESLRDLRAAGVTAAEVRGRVEV
jgi:glutamyl-Q tRNA(Asp) synthetase